MSARLTVWSGEQAIRPFVIRAVVLRRKQATLK
jgi:hypothetical protein